MSEKIVRLAARGDGVTENGRFVPFAAPGDLVDDAGAVTPGPHHATPPCRHFPECGGCQLQHVDDAAFAVFIQDRVASALAAQGLAAADIRAPHISPPNSRRRAALKVERRGETVLLGFHQEASHRIIDMRECHILRPELFALVAPLRGLLRRLLGPRSSGGVRLALTDQGADVLVEGGRADTLDASEAVTAFAQQHGLARLSLDDGYGPQTLWEPDPVTVTLSGIAVPLPHGAFLQATADGEAALVAGVQAAVGDAAMVADLFAGLGTFALALPGRVYVAEGARGGAASLKAAANRAQRQVFVDHRDLFRRPLTTAELDRFDAIVLDPPRAGAKEQVEQLAAAKVGRVAYASCNPATFARDAKALVEGGFRLDWVQPVGQFRWSTHVELVAGFSR
ncbi:class I SAM-dependent RNA methyltransferase [Sphingosinicella sp. YJ22]|uniref:class I SAM-dependent RNA methyltransferase n=1 Tax=Sphingosinicella sp. YJ22 TaxID=1104780 RepID=UPI00140B3EB5|nr:class I SAM-dependent RNA methyltransferase [Sphingosinicella sp. YJ22]